MKGTITHVMTLFKSNNLDLAAFTDADWAFDFDDRKSTRAYVVFLGDNLVSWKCKK